MLRWHHRFNRHEFGWTPWVGDAQGVLACCSSWGHRVSDTTERLNWTDVDDHIICKQWDFYFFFSNMDSIHFFSSLIAVTTMLKSSGDCGHPCFLPGFSRNVFNFSPVRIMFAVGLSYMTLLFWGMFLLCLFSGKFLSSIGVEFCQRLFLHLLR